MGAPSIVYFGSDDALRIPVLEQAGFRVARCETLGELARILDAPNLDILICSEEPGQGADAAAEMARARCGLALVLFQHPCSVSKEPLFDLVIAPGTLPSRWLHLVRVQMELRRKPQEGASPAAAEKAWSEIARDLRSVRRTRLPGAGKLETKSGDPPDEERIKVGKRSWL